MKAMQSGQAVIDCDIHTAIPNAQALSPYLSEHWNEYIRTSAFKGAVDTAYPPNAPTTHAASRNGAPDLEAVTGRPGIEALLAKLPERQRAQAAQMVEIYSYDLPFDLDGWDGYPAARGRMDAIFRSSGGNTVVVSGDSHAFWVNQLHDASGAQRVAAEFGTSSVTSPSLGDEAGGFQLGEVFMKQNREVMFCDQLAKGYVRLTLTHDAAVAEMVAVEIDRKPYASKILARWALSPTRGPGIGEIRRLPA